MKAGLLILSLAQGVFLFAQTAPSPQEFTVNNGTHLPLGLINSVSTKSSAPGDRVYLETVFPIVVGGHIVIPPGSFVNGTVTQVKRPGRMRGRGELYVRFDSLTLPNGVTRDFRARLGSVDARGDEKLDKEGAIQGASNKGGDMRTIGEAAGAGAGIGAIAGSAAGRPGFGLGVGSAAGAAAGLIGVLLTRGPDAMLSKGSTVEMILDRDLVFQADEVNFTTMAGSGHYSEGAGPTPANKNQGISRRFPF